MPTRERDRVVAGPPMNEIYLIGDESGAARAVRKLLLREGVDCPETNVLRVADAPEQLARRPVGLALVILPSSREAATALIDQIAQWPGRDLGRRLAVGSTAHPQLVIRALRHAVDDYLDEDDLETELLQALARWRATLPAHGAPGRVLALLGASGGCGASTIAVNLATLLVQKQLATLLVDLRLANGDLSALLDLRPEHTLADVCASVSRLDPVLLDRTLEEHACGLRLLAAPRDPCDPGLVPMDAVRQVLAMTRSSFRHVVIDAELGPRDEQAPVLHEAEVIALVTRLDFVSLRNARRRLEALDRIGIGQDRIQVVVNRYGQPKEVPLAKAEMALERKLTHLIPDDPWTVNRANNGGVPLVLEAPTSKVARSLIRFVETISSVPQGAKR